MAGLLKKLFGTYSSRELKRIEPIVDRVEALEDTYKKLTEEQLRGKTAQLRQRLERGETLEDILPDAFATVREASARVLGLRHYRVQLIGGVVLHQGRIAEMKTGEGKTLVATLPAYLNALTGKGVHIVTVNDYLARRDSEWMGKLYRYLGLRVGLVIHDVKPQDRKAAYEADITYGTNNEFGFDYLRDNMALYKNAMVQRGHHFAIVDEVDSILIDEARTPLIISGQGEQSTQMYQLADQFARGLQYLRVKEVDAKEEQDEIEADVIIDEKGRQATLTPRGVQRAEEHFHVENLNDPDNITLLHHINQAVKARGVMQKDVNYVVRDGQVIIVDEFTGRLMFGRRYSDGLHQAIEAKEGVKVEHESKTLATITFQNYFRLYDKLSGMTGTALTEEEEFRHTYKLDVVEIPTNKPMIRKDLPDLVYRTEAGKFRAVVEQVRQCHEKGQPVLVGTISIEKSEKLSSLLKKAGIAHHVLNAKFHEKEAQIVAQAGQSGAVTIATNMAGRGTDIVLGGNPEFLATAQLAKKGYTSEQIAQAVGYAETDDEQIQAARAEFRRLYDEYAKQTNADAEKVRAAGGLFILGTERHESRRIDNQLRGRAGRQGDPGVSCFYLSMEDDLLRLFGSDRLTGIMDTAGIDDSTPIDKKILSSAIENAQKRVESRHFQARKNVLEYDDVMNVQRGVIYEQRRKVLDGESLRDNILSMIDQEIEETVRGFVGEHPYVDPDQLAQIRAKFQGVFLLPTDLDYTREQLEGLHPDALIQEIKQKAHAIYEKKEQLLTPPVMRELERVVLLRNVDQKWMDHIDAMQELRNGINLRAYGQHDPVVEYKREGYDMFEEMIAAIRSDTVRMVYLARVTRPPERKQVAKETGTSADQTAKKEPVRKGKKVGRNDPCPCGSGKKYKKCCGMYES